MKVYIGPYINWYGPYQLAETLCFWAKERPDEWGVDAKPDWVFKFGEWLAYGSIKPDPTPDNPVSTLFKKDDRAMTPLYKLLTWIHEKRQRKVKVRIDPWDTWSMDYTLGLIALPLLKQLKQQNHGAGYVDDEDVPQHLRSTSAPPLSEEDKNRGRTDENFSKRWDWILDEMIFAFETNPDLFKIGKINFIVVMLNSRV